MGTRSNYKRVAQIGPGGMKCPCCAPPVGRPRKAAKRSWKRRERQLVRQEVAMEMAPLEHVAEPDDPGDVADFESEFGVDFEVRYSL